MKTVFTYAFIIGAAQGFLLAGFLIRKKENTAANKLLAVTMFFFATDLILETLAVTEHIKNFPLLIGLMQSFPYLYGPSIYLYVLSITRGIKKFDYTLILHYLPFLLTHVYGMFFFYFEPKSYQLNLVYVQNDLPWHVLVVSYLTPLYGAYYIGLAVIESYRFNNNMKNNFSSIDKYNLSWIKFLVIGSILLWITAMTMTFLQLIYGSEIRSELTSYLAISVFIYSMAYKGLKQPEIIVLEKEDFDSIEIGSEKYKKSGLSNNVASEHLKHLLKIMDEKKPYKNEKFSLSDLSNLTGVSKHNLSEIINRKIESSFYDFINSYRVEEVKTLIEKDKELTYSILAHGFEAGFSSKSAYYSAFKKFTGITPAQYRNKIL